MPFRRRHQKAVYWEFDSYDVNGYPVVDNPVEMDVRWEKGLSVEVTPTINPIAVSDTVWVDREVTVGSMLRQGALADLPDTPNNIREVVEYQEIPNVRGRVYERVILLKKFAGTLPTLSS